MWPEAGGEREGPERAIKIFGGGVGHFCILIIMMASWVYTDVKPNQAACMVLYAN